MPRLPLGSDAAATHLERHGYVVCAAALTATECGEVLDGMWRWLEGLGTGISRADPATWSPSGKKIVEDADCDSIGTKDACDQDDGCSWCLAGAVPPSCKTLDEARALPKSVFDCDNI